MSIIFFLNRGDVNAYKNPLIFDFILNWKQYGKKSLNFHHANLSLFEIWG